MNDNHLCIGGGIAPPAHPRLFNHSGCSVLPAFPYYHQSFQGVIPGPLTAQASTYLDGFLQLILVVELYTYSIQGIARSQAFQAAGR